MYKTVRHGENSLQYTILPQQDDATGNALPQKTASGLCRGRNHRRGTGGRTTTILVVTLFLVCSIVAGTILVPLLLTTDIIAFHKLQSTTGKIIIHHKPRLSLHRQENLTTTTTTTTVTTTTTSEENLNTLTTGVETVSNISVKSFLLDIPEGNATDGETTLALTTEKIDGTTMKEERNASEEVEGNGTMTSRNQSQNVMVEEVVTTVREERVATETVTEAAATTTTTMKPTVDPYRGWLPPRWPFADPSTYLQWTGYNASGHDRLFLPILLGSALLVVLVLVVLLYYLRRKNLRSMRREAIGKMASDLHSDEAADKASLLPDHSEEE